MIEPTTQAGPSPNNLSANETPRVAAKRDKRFDLGQTPSNSVANGQQASDPGQTADLVHLVGDLTQQRRGVDRMIERALGGEQFSAEQLLAWQARIYGYSQQLEIVSRVVDRAVGAVKTTLNTQV